MIKRQVRNLVSRLCTFSKMAGVQDLSVTKRPHLMKNIGTHSGMFHADEALACFMLKQLPEYRDAEVIRTREAVVLDTCDIVVDVGGVFDHSRKRYDHHQREFKETMQSLNSDYPWSTKLSSAGLVYFHYGHRVLAEIMGTSSSDTLTKLMYLKVYEFFVEAIDAVDNGISQTEEKPRYAMTTNLSARVSNLSPRWNETATADAMQDRFLKAMALTGSEFVDRVKYYSEAWWPARNLVEDAVAKRFEVDPSGEIMLLPQSCPWKDHLFSVEEEQEILPTVKFVLFTDQSGKWRVQCVPKELFSFDNRLSLVEAWRGVRDEELSKLTGIPGCIFVHAGGFIGGSHTYDGVLEMARRTLQARPAVAE